ncbi:hypothetical protein N7541_003315 [Penicillium brevicompactum]|uniref:Uncharacterized protein n=1 Tax=Penicillium brevicompactum TaxID=5074 RepID=A0A9W9V192_PENBR|nr:hypothetical protein N7541_003315 [Penicillium brevicompactum]
MTGLFTTRNFSLEETPDLNNRVAVVTVSEYPCSIVYLPNTNPQGGYAGIGKGKQKKVFIVARNRDKYITACDEWRDQGISLGDDDKRVEFVQCDLGDITEVAAAAKQIKQATDLLHILICNAAIGVPNEYKRSPQNVERVFATNCLGHQVLTTLLLPLLKRGVLTPSNSDVRIVVASSSLHHVCRHLDLDLLCSASRIKWPALYDGVWRYGRSKLGNVLFAKELSRRLLNDRDVASKHIYVNSFFPGNIVTEQWLGWGEYFGGVLGWFMRVLGSFGQTLQDGAATALYLAASDEVRERNHRGHYFVPIAAEYEPSSIAGNGKLARDLWDWIDAQATETLGLDWQY